MPLLCFGTINFQRVIKYIQPLVLVLPKTRPMKLVNPGNFQKLLCPSVHQTRSCRLFCEILRLSSKCHTCWKTLRLVFNEPYLQQWQYIFHSAKICLHWFCVGFLIRMYLLFCNFYSKLLSIFNSKIPNHLSVQYFGMSVLIC